MKTAVNFLVERLAENGIIHSSDIAEANELFKQQIKDAYNISWALRDKPYATADKYYNETFKSE